jgi:hypothetical protein
VDLKRIFRHLLMTRWRVRRAFSARVLSAIESAIRESHRTHAGQVRFVVEGALDSADLFDGLTARERSIDVFSQLRVWDTEHNNGILIYLLLADRDVEIVADRGIDTRVSGEEWEAICRMMEADRTGLGASQYAFSDTHATARRSVELSRRDVARTTWASRLWLCARCR